LIFFRTLPNVCHDTISERRFARGYGLKGLVKFDDVAFVDFFAVRAAKAEEFAYFYLL
jgi:hypothetical protein